MDGNLLAERTIGFVGAGNMAEAIIRGLVESGTAAAHQVSACDVLGERRRHMAGTYGIACLPDAAELAAGADIVVLAVKPQAVEAVLEAIGPRLGPERLLVSVVAGLTTAALRRRVKTGTRIVRTMPNTPALVGEGMVVLAADPAAAPGDMETVEGIFGPVGRTAVLPEGLLDAVTGLSGSGPAYVFMVIEALSDGGVRMGLPREAATTLAAQTLLGAARLLLETGRHPGQLKDMVTSPAGTTIAGVHELEAGGLRAALMNAVRAATRRSQELGRLADQGRD